MASIKLEGMRFRSFIGVYTDEQAHGNDFLVDITITSEKITSTHDQVEDTLDYVRVYRIAEGVMAERYLLLETAVQEIIKRIRELNFDINVVRVRVAKLNPPVGGDMHSVSVEMEG